MQQKTGSYRVPVPVFLVGKCRESQFKENKIIIMQTGLDKAEKLFFYL